MSKPVVSIRDGTSDDCPDVAKFLEALGKHDNHTSVANDVNELKDGFEGQLYKTFIAEVIEADGNLTVAGMAMYSYSYSMIQGRSAHLEALYVNESFRGQGLGARLLKEVAKAAHTNQCKVMTIFTVASNEAANQLYKAKGAVDMTETRNVHLLNLYDPQLSAFANS